MGPPHGSTAISNKDHDWANFFHLLSTSGVATVATAGNIFIISSIIIDDLLRKKGNSFLVSISLADLLVSAIVLPATSVAILAQTENSETLCKFQFVLGSMSCVTASIFIAIVGIENFLRLRATQNYFPPPRSDSVTLGMQISSPEKASLCSQFQVTLLNCMIWVLSAVIVVLHVIAMPQLMEATCSPLTKPDSQLILQSILLLGSVILVSTTLGGLAFIKCFFIMRSWTKPVPYVTAREFALINSNFWNWIMRFLTWCPAIVAAILTQMSVDQGSLSRSHSSNGGVSLTTLATVASSRGTFPHAIVNESQRSSQSDLLTLQQLVFWTAIQPSCFASLVYACSNKDFRRCFIQLFHYCCCKTSVTFTRRPRDNLRGGSDVRVHIIPGYNYNIYSSGSGHYNEVTSTAPRFNAFKCGPLMSYKRDIYEL